MKHRMEMKKLKWLGTVKRNGNAHAIRFLAAIEQFETKSCARCAGTGDFRRKQCVSIELLEEAA